MKIKCYSVKLEFMHSISEKCYKAVAFDGSEALIPKSQVYGRDYSRQSESWWISAWILERVSIQHSNKKAAWFEDGRMLPTYEKKIHKPERKDPVISKPKQKLLR